MTPKAIFGAGKRLGQGAPVSRAGLDVRLDEAAVTVHPLGLVKVALAAFGVVIGALLDALPLCGAWLLGSIALEVWGWWATKVQASGQPVTPQARRNFLTNYLAVNAWWAALGLIFWSTGSLEGQTCAIVLWTSLAVMVIPLFYNVPVVFALAGFAPAAAALTTIALGGGETWAGLAPILLTLALSFIFVFGRAIETPSAQASQRALNESLDQYRLLTDTVTDIICRTTLDGVHSYVSPAVEQVLGYRPEELVGMARQDLIDPETYPAVQAAVARMIADPGRSEVITCRVQHKNGKWRWLQTHAKVFCEHGRPVGIVDVTRDITEQMQADLALEAARIEAEAATRAKGEFLANISHELRTPMNGVLGALHLLGQEPISVEGRELMRQAEDCGRMLSQLLNDLLDFSKIEAGQLELAAEPMDPAAALDGVIALLDGQARDKGVALRCEIVGEPGWIAADPVRVRQVMFNLVGNAIKFTHSGHVTARLAMSGVGDTRRVRLEVEDTGVGIPVAAQAHLFERFRQADSSTARRFGGTGLGLSITRALVELMGGQVDFASVEGVGSTFWASFMAPVAEPAQAPTAEDGMLQGVQVLLVEDNPTNRLVARTLLARLGAEVAEAEDGLIGLEAARKGGFDLILMDVQMPNMDGVEATRAIRALRSPAAGVPIIGLTANVMTHQKASYMAAGMNGVVAKPINATALLTEIARILGEDEAEAAVA